MHPVANQPFICTECLTVSRIVPPSLLAVPSDERDLKLLYSPQYSSFVGLPVLPTINVPRISTHTLNYILSYPEAFRP